MEKFISVFQIITAIFIFLFAVGTTIRCIVNGSDVFYIIMFTMMALAGRSMVRYTIAEYKEYLQFTEDLDAQIIRDLSNI